MMNSSSELIVFVPACLLCPQFQAKKEGGEELLWQHDILSYLVENAYSIVQMPCPESTFEHTCCGLGRTSHGIQFYEGLPGFVDYCQKLSRVVFEEIYTFHINGHKVLAILGVEHSPTCAATYMYTRQGTVRRQGIFAEALLSLLDEWKVPIPIVGINRRFPQKLIKKLEDLRKKEEAIDCGEH